MMLILSPSAIAKYRQCARAYALEYNENIKPPSSPAQQFGTAVHAQLERWLKTGTPPDDTPEGRVAKQGLQWLPAPDPRLLLEHRFEFIFEGDVSLGGYIDCISPPGVADELPLVCDHKTTSDLRWAKDVEQLAGDAQVLIYSIWAMLEWRVTQVKVRWVYYSANGTPKKPRGSKPVEIILDYHSNGFKKNSEKLFLDILAMEKIRKNKILAKNLLPSPQSCEIFNGCFHKSRCNLSANARLAAYMERDTIIS